NEAQARQIMGQAVREAYGDLFVLRANPTDADKAILEGKFKSTHNVSDRVAKLMASTFYALLGLADVSTSAERAVPERNDKSEVEKNEQEPKESDEERTGGGRHAKRAPTNL